MLSDVTILITAGHRPGYLSQALLGISTFMPECSVVVVTDQSGDIPYTHNTFWMRVPHDTFLTKKRNVGVSIIDTKYTLVGADDFNFDIDTRATLLGMLHEMDRSHNMHVLAGTVNGRPYAGFLQVAEGEYIKETRVKTHEDFGFYKVDIAANFFLARTEVLREVRWDESIGPIGGEHADWFLDLKSAGKFVAWSPEFNIDEQVRDKSKEAPYYREMRARAWEGHELFLKKRGVKKYFSFDEDVI